MHRWQRWATSPECERDFPAIRSISLFQRVLLVQALRPDRLQSALHQFTGEVLRVSSLSPAAQSLESLHQQESSGETSLFIPCFPKVCSRSSAVNRTHNMSPIMPLTLSFDVLGWCKISSLDILPPFDLTLYPVFSPPRRWDVSMDETGISPALAWNGM